MLLNVLTCNSQYRHKKGRLHQNTGANGQSSPIWVEVDLLCGLFIQITQDVMEDAAIAEIIQLIFRIDARKQSNSLG